MRCGQFLCVYNKKYQCVLDNVEFDIYGNCCQIDIENRAYNDDNEKCFTTALRLDNLDNEENFADGNGED